MGRNERADSGTVVRPAVVRAHQTFVSHRAQRKFRASMSALIEPGVNLPAIVPKHHLDAQQTRGFHVAWAYRRSARHHMPVIQKKRIFEHRFGYSG